MKTKFIDKKIHYSGHQLKPLFAYLEHQVLGDSIVSWVGSCNVAFAEMIDGEDLLEKAAIRGDEMLHFIVEAFDRDLFSAVCLQRLLASQIKDCLLREIGKANPSIVSSLRREGDDLYLGEGKLSISIASRSAISVQLHFAINITNDGTPVKTASLKDCGISDIQSFAESIMKGFASEFEDILQATRKVRPLN